MKRQYLMLVCIVVAASSFAQEGTVNAEEWARESAVRAQMQVQLDADIRRKFIQNVLDAGGRNDIDTELSVLDVAPADLSWVLVTMQTQEDSGLSAAEILATPTLQLSHKLLADVASQPYSGAKPIAPASPEFNKALMQSLSVDLAPYAYMHEAVPEGRVEDLLWLAATRHLDGVMLEDSTLTADDLLSSPEYMLARKVIADMLAASIANCVRCSDPSAPYYAEPLCVAPNCQAQFEFNLRICDIAIAWCRLNPFSDCREVMAQCICVVNCVNCHCLAGTIPYTCQNDCRLDPGNPCR